MFSQRFALPSVNLLHVFVSRNPTPGIVINRPNGTDVYKGVPKDYTGDVGASTHVYLYKSVNQSCGISTLFGVQTKLNYFGLGFFSAGCDSRELPGCAEGRFFKHYRRLRKSVEEASDLKCNKVWRREPLASTGHVFVLSNLDFFVLAAAPTITCLCTSPTTGHLVFWLFPMMRWEMFYFLLLGSQ